ncbi:MAG: hypothetical protein N2560_10350, partial [Ignavibacteria bacterium]|nr:hypothetical protein [Ignavibacteria bacterium]
EWCWCNCIPGQCWDEECARRGGAPYFKYNHIRYLETNPGACDFVPYGYHPNAPDDLKFNRPWMEPLRCVRIYWDWGPPPSQNCSD